VQSDKKVSLGVIKTIYAQLTDLEG
jgi:hypothetical protein